MKQISNRSRTEYSILNILAGVGGYIISVILSMVSRMVFTRCLPPAYLGISGLFSNILAMLSLAELGVGGAIVYALYKPLAENDEEKIASLVAVFGKVYRTVGLVIGGAGLCLLPFLSLIIGEGPEIRENLHIIYLIYLFNTASSYFFTYRSTLLVAAQKNYLVTGINYLVLCIQAVVQAILLVTTKNYMAYLLTQVLFTLLYNICVSKIAGVQFPYIKNKTTKPLEKAEKTRIYKDTRDLTLYKVSGVLVNGTDNIIITLLDGLVTTGLASNYTLLVNTLNALLGQVFDGITSSLGNHNVTESAEKRYEMYRFLNMVNFWLFGWGAIGVYFCTSDIVALVFGNQYVLGNAISAIMAANFFAYGVTYVIRTYKQTMGLFKYGRFLQLVTAAINVILSVALGRVWGLFGILLATLIARMCTHLWYNPYVVFKYGFQKKAWEYVKQYIKYLAILAVAIGLCDWAIRYLQGPLIVMVVVKILLCSLITNVVFWITLARTQEFSKAYSYFRIIMKKIKGR